MVAMGTDKTGFCGSGTIKADGTEVERSPWYRGMGNQPEHKVDTAPPVTSSVALTSRPANGEAYTAGETISVEVGFSEEIDAGNTASLSHATVAADASQRVAT